MDTSTKISASLEEFRKGDSQNAFCTLANMPHDVLPDIIATFKNEKDRQVRAFLVHIVWQHRQQSVIPFLAEVLNDPEPVVWKEALDGLVTLASPEAIKALRSAKKRQFKHDKEAQNYSQWIDEAIEQAESATRKP